MGIKVYQTKIINDASSFINRSGLMMRFRKVRLCDPLVHEISLISGGVSFVHISSPTITDTSGSIWAVISLVGQTLIWGGIRSGNSQARLS